MSVVDGIFSNQGLWGMVKVMMLVGEGVFIIFSLIVVRQVQLMIGTLDGGANNLLKAISWLLLLGAISLFVFSLILL